MQLTLPFGRRKSENKHHKLCCKLVVWNASWGCYFYESCFWLSASDDTECIMTLMKLINVSYTCLTQYIYFLCNNQIHLFTCTYFSFIYGNMKPLIERFSIKHTIQLIVIHILCEYYVLYLFMLKRN